MYYSKWEMERMICWVDGQRRYYEELHYKVPELSYIRAVEAKIDSLTHIISKWQYRLAGIKVIEK